ncbi:MAG: isoleucine--tRNA ligase [Chitinophagales bacterium]
MSNTLEYRIDKEFNLPKIEKEILQFWQQNDIFEKSIRNRPEEKPFVFYEGPPSANGLPGIHHVISRTIKDIFCRYKSLKGYRVLRKGGWDTHGLPIELSVEKKMGITKEDIGKSISVADYNKACRETVMQFREQWNELTTQMGYWLDLDNPYITYENSYIESLWYLLQQLYQKGYLYKGYTIQPFSPAAGTGLSSHELNQPGCYREVTDTTVVAQFKIKDQDVYFLAWTTTPWTLPSNTALAVGANIDYVKVKTYNPYTHLPVSVILAKDRLLAYFKPENEQLDFEAYQAGDKNIPYQIVDTFKGKDLEGIAYEQLMPYAQPKDGDAFRVLVGDFVTTEDGTGIVHIAPSFGSDDLRVARQNGIGSLTLVDRQGKFVDEVTDFAGRYVKDYKDQADYVSVDVDIAVMLKKENKAFKIEKYPHNYPHCWRTDKPVIYYPLDSWFIQVTKVKDRMIALNETINWKPAATGTGRFGNWLENLQDWNLSRSRYWGTPLPIWRTEDGNEEICIGSIAELVAESEKAAAAGLMPNAVSPDVDLHKPYVDEIVLVAPSGKPMYREADLIDVWFDSGAMPYAQWHYPFETKEIFNANYPADFIAEGVDQTRGWFYTLHAISTMISDSVAYKNVISNGLVLDKFGQKMSKRKGNTVDPFETIATYGADTTRWYMISNAQPWDNLKFDMETLQDNSRKFFGTLFNTYNFFALYANIDAFHNQQTQVPVSERPEIDRWIISRLNSLVQEVDTLLADYEPTRAARSIENFLDEDLSNWYVRLNRKRFWSPSNLSKSDARDKLAAYQTLYTCLDTLACLISPIAPFFAEYLSQNLNNVTGLHTQTSVHLRDFPQANAALIDTDLETEMRLAQQISSQVLALRKSEKIKVRQPLQKILIPILSEEKRQQILKVQALILSETNVKEIEFVEDTTNLLVKNIKPDFKILGKKLGGKMKAVKQVLEALNQVEIALFEKEGFMDLNIDDEPIRIGIDEVEIHTADIPGWLVNTQNDLTVALDISLTPELITEGNAREIVNKLQNLRKESGFDVTDKIFVQVERNKELFNAFETYKQYISQETLINRLDFIESINENDDKMHILDINGITLKVILERV